MPNPLAKDQLIEHLREEIASLKEQLAECNRVLVAIRGYPGIVEYVGTQIMNMADSAISEQKEEA